MSVQTLQDIYPECLFYLRKPRFLQIGKELNLSNFFIFFSKKCCKYSNYYNYACKCDV